MPVAVRERLQSRHSVAMETLQLLIIIIHNYDRVVPKTLTIIDNYYQELKYSRDGDVNYY